MDDLEQYIKKRKKKSKTFALHFENGYEEFKVGIMLQRLRQDSGLTQNEFANKIQMKRTAISRIENHADDIKLSTLEKYATALGKHLTISIS